MQRTEPFKTVLLKESGLVLLSANPEEADSAVGILATNVAASPALILATYLEYQGADGVSALRIGRAGVPIAAAGTEIIFSIPLLHEALEATEDQRRSSARTQVLRAPQKILRTAVVTAERDFYIRTPIALPYIGETGSGLGEFVVTGPAEVHAVDAVDYPTF